MLGMSVTKDSALRVLTDLENEIRQLIKDTVRDGKLPQGKGYYGMWVDRYEERLLTIDALRALVLSLPNGATILP